MEKDRAAILKIFEEMFDSVDSCGIYPTTVAYDRLEKLVEAARAEANCRDLAIDLAGQIDSR